MPTTAIAILNWNGAEMLRRFLPSVVRHSAGEGMEVVVIDNGSDDNSAEVLEKEFPTVRTVMLDKNYGFAGGYNKGLEHIDPAGPGHPPQSIIWGGHKKGPRLGCGAVPDRGAGSIPGLGAGGIWGVQKAHQGAISHNLV